MTQRRVLIVEDELLVRMHLERIVGELGHRVVGTAADAREALEAAEREAPELALMDIHLAGGSDGVGTAQEISERFGCAVIFITAYADAATVERTGPVGAAGYLVKPFTAAAVRASIATALSSHARLSESRRRERALASVLAAEAGPTGDREVVRRPFGHGTRLLAFSHDTFGLGHLRRTLNLLRVLCSRHPGLSALLVTGSPMVHRYPMPAGVDYVKLPAVRKVAPEEYQPRTLPIPGSDMGTLRGNLILRTLRDYEPSVLLVDHSPVGSKGELLPSLEWLATRGSCTRILGLRDIIDEPRAIIDLWKKNGTYDVLRSRYDHVVVYGVRDVYDPVTRYEFPDDVAAKTRFVHYVCDRSEPEAPGEREADSRPMVAVSVGGGDGGGETVIAPFLEMMRRHRDEIDFRAEVVMGPFVSPDLEQRLRTLAVDLPVDLTSFVPSTSGLFARADLVVSTAGYNTVTDLLAHARRSILVPRVLHRQEQLIRARRMEELGLATCLHPDHAAPDVLFDAVRRARSSSDEPLARARAEGLVPLDGAERFSEFCGGLLVDSRP